MPAEIDHVAALVPGWDSATVESEPLGGGRTNRNFLVRVDGTPYVLRLAAPHALDLGIRRSDESAIHRAAADAGLAPRVLWADEDRGLLVSDFVRGWHWSPQDIHRDGNMVRLTGALRAAHALRVDASTFDPIALGLQFEARCDAASLPPRVGAGCVRRVRAVASRGHGRGRPCLCHNDVGRGNFIDDGSRLWFIDWECAGIGDPFYDLAIISHNHRLSPAQEADLLRAYGGQMDAADVEHLARAKVAHDFYHVFWYASQLSAGEGADDCRRCCAFHADRLDEELRAFGDDGSYRPPA